MKPNQLAVLETNERRYRRRLRFTDEPTAAPVNVAYSYEPAINGDGGPYTVTLESGALPTGLALATNIISGTPTVLGSTTVWLKVTDAIGRSASRPFTFAVV